MPPSAILQMVFIRRRERCDAREDDGSVHRTLSKSDRRNATRSSLINTIQKEFPHEPYLRFPPRLVLLLIHCRLRRLFPRRKQNQMRPRA